MSLTFDEVVAPPSSRGHDLDVAVTKSVATDAFMDLLVFAQAGLCELQQIKSRDHTKFTPLLVFKTSL
jgi:hypothetical protein